MLPLCHELWKVYCTTMLNNPLRQSPAFLLSTLDWYPGHMKSLASLAGAPRGVTPAILTYYLVPS